MKLLPALAAICGGVKVNDIAAGAIIVNDYANSANSQSWVVKTTGAGNTLLLQFANDANIAFNVSTGSF